MRGCHQISGMRGQERDRTVSDLVRETDREIGRDRSQVGLERRTSLRLKAIEGRDIGMRIVSDVDDGGRSVVGNGFGRTITVCIGEEGGATGGSGSITVDAGRKDVGERVDLSLRNLCAGVGG